MIEAKSSTISQYNYAIETGELFVVFRTARPIPITACRPRNSMRFASRRRKAHI